jgi:hypothetical protein
LIRGLDRLLARLRRRGDERGDPGEQRDESSEAVPPDAELEGRIDAARVRLREKIAPRDDGTD